MPETEEQALERIAKMSPRERLLWARDLINRAVASGAYVRDGRGNIIEAERAPQGFADRYRERLT
jgi:hypothetical protein